MLELCELHCFYNEAHIIHGVSLDVAPGEVVALLGGGIAQRTSINASQQRNDRLADFRHEFSPTREN